MRIPGLLVCPLLTAAVLAGCGSSFSLNTDSGEPPGTNVTSVSETTEQTQQTSEEITSEQTSTAIEPDIAPVTTEALTEPDAYSGSYAFGYSGDSFIIQVRDTDYYYWKLSDFDREIYDCITDAANHTNDLTYSAKMYVADSQVDMFNADFWFVYECFTNDHPELFDYELNETDDSYPISINYTASDKSGYWYANVTPEKTIPGFYDRIMALDAAAETFLSSIDLNTSEYEIMRQIHDKLINDCTIDYGSTGEGDDTKLGAYTVLVGNRNGDKTGVCNNYTKACGYLLKKCGITYVPKYGGIGNDPDYAKAYNGSSVQMGDHIWVMSKLNGKWYETDVLWDETESFPEETYHYRFFCLTSEKMCSVYDDLSGYWTVHMPAYDEHQDYYNYDQIRRISELLPVAE